MIIILRVFAKFEIQKQVEIQKSTLIETLIFIL